MKQTLRQDYNIGEKIKDARASVGLSQDQVAARLQIMGCDISRGTLAKIEAGIRNIKVSELSALKKTLKFEYDFIFKDVP